MHAFIKTVMLFLFVLIPLNSFSADNSILPISIRGDISNPRQWSVEQLKAQFADQIMQVKFKDPLSSWKEKTGSGVPLYSLIKEAEPKLEIITKWTQRDRGDAKTHTHMLFIVILEAEGDSFRAVFSLAELMAEFRATQVYLVWDKDGEPLSDKDGPMRLVVLNDKQPDREIYGISSITIVDCDKLARQLKAR